MPAAGRGVRLGPGPPKSLRPLGGAPLLVHAVRALASSSAVDLVVVAAPPADVSVVRALVADQQNGGEVCVVGGGDTRHGSVARALAALPEDVDVVLVHDAARPLAPVDLVTRVATAVRDGAAAVVPVLPVPDTVKEIEPVGATARVVRTLDRASICAVQTPQGFRRALLDRAHREEADDGREVTDDAGLVERLGVEVLVVAGSAEAFKVTQPLDLVFAEALLERRQGAGTP